MEPDIPRVVDDIKKEKGVEAIYLFGSRAAGRARHYPDTDICVITGEGGDRKSILSNSSRRVDTSIFWDLPIGIRYRVIRDGRPLFVRDELEHHRIRVRTVLSYLDFRPLLERRVARALS